MGHWEHVPEPYNMIQHFPLTRAEYYRKFREFFLG